MAWGGMRGGPCPSIYSHGGGLGGGMRGGPCASSSRHGGGIRGRDERMSGRMRGLVGD
jgi:hypothetical protein